ncbi:hypothetical protein [Nonomuraea soli]|uniref:Uncharacterized protein n=1 Tax=Nonomuraea soli TaxID=1032476 RepID=A0A7W0HQ15_9ACTN|nr:hypothetical protein [Nonomuraea soli]MBA2891444.1 hypothetical protein [Nonomuraea soli]
MTVRIEDLTPANVDAELNESELGLVSGGRPAITIPREGYICSDNTGRCEKM